MFPNIEEILTYKRDLLKIAEENSINISSMGKYNLDYFCNDLISKNKKDFWKYIAVFEGAKEVDIEQEIKNYLEKEFDYDSDLDGYTSKTEFYCILRKELIKMINHFISISRKQVLQQIQKL